SITTVDATVDQGDIADGDTFTLSDGFHDPVVFEFDVGGGNTVTLGHVQITLLPKPLEDDIETAAEGADKIRNAIERSGLDLMTDPKGEGNEVVSITNLRSSSRGNQPIGKTGNISTSFVFRDLALGAAGDCPANTGCLTDADCASNMCLPDHTCR